MSASDQRIAFAYFVGRGWSLPQTAGIVANLVAESDLNPAAVGDGGQAYGIAQWHPDRQQGFKDLFGFAIQGSELADQFAWVHAELTSTEKAAGNALRACTTAAGAGACVSMLYERPADKDGEAHRRGALAESLLQQYGGMLDGAQPAPTVQPTGVSMPIGALLSMLLPLIPQIAGMFKPGSTSAVKDATVAQSVLQTVVQVAGAVGGIAQPIVNAATVGAAVDKMSADPALTKQVTQAVVTHPDVLPYVEVGGGAAAARAADVVQQASDKPFWKVSAVFWVSTLLIPLVFWYVGASIVGGVVIPDAWPWYAQIPLKLFGLSWDPGAKVGLANLVVGLVLGGICGVYYGVSVTQAKQQQQSTTGVSSNDQ